MPTFADAIRVRATAVAAGRTTRLPDAATRFQLDVAARAASARRTAIDWSSRVRPQAPGLAAAIRERVERAADIGARSIVEPITGDRPEHALALATATAELLAKDGLRVEVGELDGHQHLVVTW